jgi:hypothetical protein
MPTQLYDRDATRSVFLSVDEYPYIGKIQEEIRIGEVIKLGKNHYVACILNHEKKAAAVKKLTLKRNRDEVYDNDFICPLCGYIDQDSWELPEGDDTVECGRCGAEIEYSKEFTVHFTTKIVKEPEITVVHSIEE